MLVSLINLLMNTGGVPPTPSGEGDNIGAGTQAAGRYNQRDAEEEMKRKMIGQEEDDFMFISGIITRIINNN